MAAVVTHPKALWQISEYTAAAVWVASVWDGLIRLDSEVTFIWPMAHTAYVKWMYFFSKFFGLAVQTILLGIQAGYLAKYDMSIQSCRIYRTLEMGASSLLTLCFDVVLLLRIFALYGRNSCSSRLATSAVVVEFVTTIACVISTIPVTIYDSACMMIQIPRAAIFIFEVATFITQAILLWLTFRKRERVVRSRSSITCVTIRDGMLVFVAFAVYLVVLFMFTLGDSPITTLMLFWLPMVTSVATCRIILNIQRTPQRVPSHQFTSEIDGLDRSADSFLLSDIPHKPRSPMW